MTTGTTEADAKREGYYVRFKYNFTPEWVGVVQYSYADFYKTGDPHMRSDVYSSTSIGLNCFLTPNSTIMGQFEFADASRSDDSEKLKFDRFTLGWRTTF